MKTLALALVAASVCALVGCGGSSGDSTVADDADVTSDVCRGKAVTAAENEYGNSPDGTKTTVLTKSKKYRVTVGINNPEDGPHDYYVTFASGCGSTPKVSEVPSLAHPLRDASHGVYAKLLAAHANEMPSSVSAPASSLPAAARKQLATWSTPAHSSCTAVNSYKVTVAGQDTFAITCTVPQDSIKFDIAIYDSKGGDIDEAAVYHTKDVGQNGVSWQNETFLQQDN